MKMLFKLTDVLFAAAFLFFGAFYCPGAVAQPESFVLQDNVGSPINTKVRYANETKAVGYFEEDRYGYFMLIDLNTATITHKVRINSEFFYVSDFRVLGDTVYACGRRLVPPEWNGFIMKFHKDSIQGPGSFQFVDIDSTTELTRMVVYPNTATSNVEIVAIGYKDVHMGSYVSKQGWIVDCQSVASLVCWLMKRYSNGSTFETFDDIVLTDNYVCTVGCYDGSATAFRKSSRNSFDVMSGIMGTLNYFVHPDIDPASRLHATGGNLDSVTVAAYAVNSVGSFTTRIRQYNLSNMTMAYGYEIPSPEKSEPEELAYSRLYTTYLMLDYLPYIGSGSNCESQAVTRCPSGVNAFETYYVPGTGMTSIAASPIGRTFMLAGYGIFAMKQLGTMHSSSCLQKVKISKKDLHRDIKEFIRGNRRMSYGGGWNSGSFQLIEPQFERRCLSYNKTELE